MDNLKIYQGVCRLLLVAVMFSFAGCADRYIPGGSCAYVDIPGTATVVSISAAPDGAYNCDNEPVVVLFDFVPDDPEAGADSRGSFFSDRGQQLTVGAGQNPPRAYLNSRGITVGSSHPCIKQEIVEGSCTPVQFVFPGMDFFDYADYCW